VVLAATKVRRKRNEGGVVISGKSFPRNSQTQKNTPFKFFLPSLVTQTIMASQSQNETTFLFFNLPVELQHEIVNWLSIRGLGLFSQISMLCNDYACSNVLWRRYFSKLTNDNVDAAMIKLATNKNSVSPPS